MTRKTIRKSATKLKTKCCKKKKKKKKKLTFKRNQPKNITNSSTKLKTKSCKKKKKKKKINFETKPTENSGKPEELWKTRKARGLLNKVSIATVNAVIKLI